MSESSSRDRRPLAGTGAGGPPDLDLLRRMREGDERALEVLYKRYGGLIFTLALRIVGDPELAREVLQDTFLRCWDGRETYDAGRGRVAWWLTGITRNRAIDLLRSRPHQGRLREQEILPGEARMSDSGPSEAAEASALRRAVASALESLSTAQRRAIELAYYGGFTQTEIARDLGEPLGTVKSRTREGLERLRVSLRPLIEPKREE
jgi:RNA polymerase sigma-70 factor, ECF subfamily